MLNITALSIIFSFFTFLSISGFSHKLFVVTSGSMEPTLPAGSIVFIRPVDDYKVGDIVTFKNSQNSVVTHRIIDSENGHYITRGDANVSSDHEIITKTNIMGKKSFLIPVVGRAVIFAKKMLPILS